MNAESVKSRLKKIAQETGRPYQDMLTYYGLERVIYRIAKSDYAEHFVLKGGIFLYAIYDRHYERATTDIDLLARRIGNSSEEMKLVFQTILSQKADDAIVFDIDSVSVENITEFKEYHGLHVSAIGYLDRTKLTVAIDIGFGDIVYPDTVKMDFPVILSSEQLRITAYSLETAIAEKLEAIIHNGYLNSRYKDFYDIYVLSRNNSFQIDTLLAAVTETFKNRKTPMSMNTAAFGEEFAKDPIHQARWNAFLRRKKALLQVSLSDTINRIKEFAQPLLSDVPGSALTWNPDTCRWE